MGKHLPKKALGERKGGQKNKVAELPKRVTHILSEVRITFTRNVSSDPPKDALLGCINLS